MPVRQALSQAGFGGGGGVVDAVCCCLLPQPPITTAKASKLTASTDVERLRFFDGFAKIENVALLKVFKFFSPCFFFPNRGAPERVCSLGWLVPTDFGSIGNAKRCWMVRARGRSNAQVYNTANALGPTKSAQLAGCDQSAAFLQ
jgi:hypothetical protein